MNWSFANGFVRARRLCALVGGLLVCALASAPSAFAASTPTVDLGQAAGYAVISGASVANTDDSTVRGDIGAPAMPSGFPPGVLVGNMQVGSADATAYNDMLTAYTEVQSRTGGAALPALAGATLTPGLYTSAAAAGLAASANVTLDGGGNPNAVFVIQVNGALSLGAGAQVKLTGGAQASNVFWQVNGAFSVGAAVSSPGRCWPTPPAAIGAGRLVNGRVLAQTAVTMDDDRVLQRPADGHAHRRRRGGYQQLHPDDQRDHQRRRVRGGHRDRRRADADRDPVGAGRQLVGDPHDIAPTAPTRCWPRPPTGRGTSAAPPSS